MISRLKSKLHSFFNEQKDYPFLAAFLCGLYPILFYYSNNFTAINSIDHLVFFILFFFGIPLIIFTILHYCIQYNAFIKKNKGLLFLILIIAVLGLLMSQAMFLTIKKKVIFVILLCSFLISLKWLINYKKLLVIVGLMCVIPLVKVGIFIIEDFKPVKWNTLPDDIEDIKFNFTPNIYLIQPDGYVGEDVMNSEPYNFENEFYEWLDANKFKVYKGFHSNYPASLASNASLFSMRHHYFENMIFPSLELTHARRIICGDNPVVTTFKRNNYHTSFIVTDEYFQQNRPPQLYDYYNIDLEDIPFFSNDNNIKRDVFKDMKYAMSLDVENPRFYFIEKLLPHHSNFNMPLDKDRLRYISRIEEVNAWLKNLIQYIEKNDDNAVIIVLADHGGWLGLNSYKEMFNTTNETLLKSTFSSIAAIKWNGYLDDDSKLKSNVNVFRFLFSALSDDKMLLDHMEKDDVCMPNGRRILLP